MSSPLLAIPSKTTQDVDFGPAIKSTIHTLYGEDGSSYAEEIAALNRCRQDALRGSAGSDATARDLLFKYFGQLELLELRFADLRVPFPWSDALTHKSISQLSLAYEKASVIYNIGATLSSIAAAQPRSSPEGLKRAFNLFRQAAGMFTYINENFLHAPSTDLSKDVIKTMVTLLNAQTTELFGEQLSEQKKSAGLKARVCQQAAHLYGSTLSDVKDFVSKSWFPRSWSYLIQAKASYFSAQAQLHKATADSAASKYGDALRRLMMAADHAKQASAHAYTFSSVYSPGTAPTLPPDAVPTLNEVTKKNLDLCNEALQTAKKENDLIYHASITSEASLPAIDKAPVAEPIPIQEVYAAPEVQKTVGQDIFTRLVPLSVHESASMYSEEKAKLVRAQSEAVDTADTEVLAALEYMGLPGSLSRFTANTADTASLTDLGPQLREWISTVHQEETQPGPTMQRLLAELQQLKAQVASTFENAARQLDVEEKACESARIQHADSGFDQAPSSSLSESKALRADIKDRRDAIHSASSSDDMVMQAWSDCKADAELLMDPSGEKVEAVFAQTMAGASGHEQAQDLLGGDFEDQDQSRGQMDGAIRAIQENLNHLHSLRKERSEVLRDLKEKVQADDISHLLILNRKSQNIEPTLFASELEKFRSHSNRIAATVHHQQGMLSQVTMHFKGLTESKKGREIQNVFASADRKRKELLNRFQAAFESYMQVRSGATKGAQFYREMSDYAENIKSRASAFVGSRDSERQAKISSAQASSRSMQSSVEDKMGGLNLDGALRAPPPRPSYAAQSPVNGQPQMPMRPGSVSSPVSSSPQRSFSGQPYPPPPPQQQHPVYAATSASPYPAAPQPQHAYGASSPSPYPAPPARPQQAQSPHVPQSPQAYQHQPSFSGAPATAAGQYAAPSPHAGYSAPPPQQYHPAYSTSSPSPYPPPPPQVQAPRAYQPPSSYGGAPQPPPRQPEPPRAAPQPPYAMPATSPQPPQQPQASADPYAGLQSLGNFGAAPPASNGYAAPPPPQYQHQHQQQYPSYHQPPPQTAYQQQPQPAYGQPQYQQQSPSWQHHPQSYGQPPPPPRPY